MGHVINVEEASVRDVNRLNNLLSNLLIWTIMMVIVKDIRLPLLIDYAIMTYFPGVLKEKVKKKKILPNLKVTDC